MLRIKLTAHERLHTRPAGAAGVGELACSQCPRRFRQLYALREHELAQHETLTDLYCPPPCRTRLGSIPEMKSHIFVHHANEADVAAAAAAEAAAAAPGAASDEASDAKFVRDWLLRHNRRALMCNKCPRTFPSSNKLYEHELAHHREKRHTCDQCGKGLCEHELTDHRV